MEKPEAFITYWNTCVRCEISKFSFRHVICENLKPCKFLFVGEAPGVSEDALGEPFVGASGKLLREALEFAGFDLEDCAITNLVACRPTDKAGGPNRAPTKVEVGNCRTRLSGIMLAVQPVVVIAVGRIAATEISENHSYKQMVGIVHPAFILRNGGRKSSIYHRWIQELRDIKNFEVKRESDDGNIQSV